MMRLPEPSAQLLLRIWKKLGSLPGGQLLFRKGLAFVVPYSATIDPEIMELRPGFVKIRLKDHRRVRNHLGSIHAVALANLAELASGLALNTGLPQDARAILKQLHVDYPKKARGTLIAESSVPLPDSSAEIDWKVEVTTKDEKGDVVTQATAIWQIGPKPTRPI